MFPALKKSWIQALVIHCLIYCSQEPYDQDKIISPILTVRKIKAQKS